MAPSVFLAIVVLITLGAFAASRWELRARRRAFQKLASEWAMHYSPTDRFDLAPRVAARFPFPGAAELRIVDLIYGSELDHYRYYFTAEYTLGAARIKRRLFTVATVREPKARCAGGDWSPLVLADPNIPLFEQYSALRERTGPEPADASADDSPAAHSAPPTGSEAISM